MVMRYAPIDRRKFVLAASNSVLGALATNRYCASEERPSAKADTDQGYSRANPIAVSTYSFWRFKDDSKLSIPRCVDEAARMGFDAVEILQMQMDNEENGF